MKLWLAIRKRLGWKLFLSYLIVVIVGVAVLSATATLNTPSAVGRHMQRMAEAMGNDPALLTEERQSFVAAVNEVLMMAAVASVAAAIAVSVFTTSRIVNPIRAMRAASQHIAAGDYHKRVQLAEPDELGALALSFNQMAEQLEQTEQRRVALIGNVAHELRTPLASIKSTMEGLVDGVLPSDEATYLSVQREVTRLQRLVQDLEELSHAEGGQIRLELQPTNLSVIAQAAVERLRLQFEDKAVALQIDAQPHLPQVRADTNRITQVIVNLLGNALQYTPSSGSVHVRVWRESNEVLLAVEDTGIGIAAEHLPHVFERFYRVDKSRSRVGGGSGIGLTIARHLIKAQGGRIWVTSPGVERGSTFAFALPLA